MSRYSGRVLLLNFELLPARWLGWAEAGHRICRYVSIAVELIPNYMRKGHIAPSLFHKLLKTLCSWPIAFFNKTSSYNDISFVIPQLFMRRDAHELGKI